MSEINGIDDLIRQINELDANIATNADVYPLIHDMFKFIKDIIPILLEFNAFMQSESHKIPSASENIHDISHTTEQVTHEVLDKLDLIKARIKEIRTELKNSNDAEKILEHLKGLESMTAEIYLSFQFQDITNQKLEYVNRVLEAIYDKFIDLFNSSIKIQGQTIFGKDIIAAIERELEKGTHRHAFEKFKAQTTDLVRSSDVSQELIDKYFEKNK